MGCGLDCGCASDSSSKVQPSAFGSMENDPVEVQVFNRNRSCTDIPALIVFIVLLGGFGYLIIHAIKTGNPNRIVNGMDYCANICGYNNPPLIHNFTSVTCKAEDMRNRPYLLTEWDSAARKTKTCVSECKPPNKNVFLKRCFPENISFSANSILNALNLEGIHIKVAQDLNIARTELLYLVLIALVTSLGILIAFRYIVQYVIYIVLIGVVVVSLGGTAYLWREYLMEKALINQGKVLEADSSITSYLVYAIIMTVVAVLTILIVLVMRKRIGLVLQLFRETGKAVYSMPVLLLQPIYTYIIVGLSFSAWVYCILYIESAGELYKDTRDHLKYKKDTVLYVARWYNILIFFIMFEFYLGCQHMVVAGAVSRWFFTRDKKQLSLPVVRSGFCLVRFHIGTVAFGAMIIGFVRFIRFVLAKVQKTLKRYTDNGCARGILWCCQCCLWCFECALKFLTRNAYIETAIYGCNFCTGGRKAFRAISDNILRVAAINSVGDFVLFLGKVLVVALTVVAGVYLIQEKKGLHYPWIVISIGGVFAFIIAHCFISIYEMIIDTIFICFCEDCASNDGISRPYFMSRGLMEFVENSKKALKNLENQAARS